MTSPAIPSLAMKSTMPHLKATIAVGVIIAWLCYLCLHFYERFNHRLDEETEITRLTSSINIYDAKLTNAALLAAITGEQEWLNKHAEYSLTLDDVIREVGVFAHDADMRDYIQNISTANNALIAMEEEVFALVEQKKLKQARALLSSRDYLEQKKRYKEALEGYIAIIKEITADEIGDMDLGLIFASIFVLLGFYIYIMLNFRKTEILRHNAEQLSTLKSEFLANMSHEIRTPMNGILGMAELILSKQSTPQIAGYARTIINSGESLLNIINDILDFSKIEAGRMELDIMPVDMLELVDDVVTLYSTRARDNALELAVRYVPSTEQFLYADPLRIRQILSNLINNAIKFTPKGYIAITVSEDNTPPIEEGYVRLVISVQDTGIGMSDAVQSQIFSKFTQADSSTTRRYGGTGLGLSICKSLIALMGGTISVKSAEGKGSCFTMTLLLKRNVTEQRITAKPPILRDLRVLIVDDLPIIRQLVSEQLQIAGMRCDTASSGKEALEMMQAAHAAFDPYNIAILDYLMPEMNGEMLASAINDYDHLRHTCLVMLTAAGLPPTDESFAQKGFSAFIGKPIEIKALIRSLAIIWHRYSQGETHTLIHVDTGYIGQLEQEQDAAHSLMANNATILVAEDNIINQAFIREILEEMGCACLIVANGQEAVDAVQKYDVDLIIMDCLMPVMDGFEATQKIIGLKKAGVVRQTLPIIALTANAMKGDREKCLNAGMDEYITKPVRKKELKDKVCQWLEQNNAAKKGSVLAKKPIVTEAVSVVASFPLHEPEKEKTSAMIIPISQSTPHTASVTPFLDEEAITQAKAILGVKYATMLQLFFANCEEKITEMQVAQQSSNNADIIRPAHTLKSTAMQMGAVALSEQAKQLEHMLKSPVPPSDVELQQRLHTLLFTWQQTKPLMQGLSA